MKTAKKTAQKRILSFLTFLAVILSAAQLILIQNTQKASAGSLWDSQTGLSGSGSEIGSAFGQTGSEPDKDIRVIVAGVIKIFLGFIGITFVILLILAGYKWMTAGGNEENVKEAKSQITRAVIGLIIILMAWGITELVTTCVLKASGATSSIWYCPQLN